MDISTSVKQPVKPLVVSDRIKYIAILVFACSFVLFAFIMNTPKEIVNGMKEIIISPSILITDYIAVGNIGSAFFNSGTLMLLALLIAYINKTHMNGTLIAAIFTVGGFAFFGKNIYNVISIIIGVYLYSIIQKEKFSKFILIAFFGTALGPLVSQLSFGFGEPTIGHILLGNVAGIITGIILPPLAGHYVVFHQGFSLYSTGFTCGIIGSIFMSLLKAFDKTPSSVYIVSSGNNLILGTTLCFVFITFIVVGFILNGKSFKNYVRLFRHSGRLIGDFVIMDGFPVTYINMGVLGMVTLLYVLIINGELNGPTIGGILTVVGFGAFGKHVKNVIPILIGVFLGALLQIYDLSSTATILAALFGTTLAPIAGKFGWKAGILAGFLHLTVVMNVGLLHGGMNLYNNGFSGGFVAATLVPFIESFRKEDD